jgi:hypothetical protein
LAWLRGHTWSSDPSTDAVVALATNTSGNTRIDRIVLRYSRTTNNVTVAVVQGTPSGSPVTPALTQNTGSTGVFEISLARVTLANNYTTVAAGNVQVDQWWLNAGNVITTLGGFRPPIGDVGQESYNSTTGLWEYWTGSLWQQQPAVMEFATVSARDAAITSPTAGMVCYTDDYKLLWYYRGSAWRFVAGQLLYSKVDTSTSFLTNVSGTQNVFTSSTVTLPGGGQAYEFDWKLMIGNGGFTNGQLNSGLQLNVNGAGAVTLAQSGYFASNATGSWSVGSTQTWKSGSSDVSVAMTLQALVIGGNYDVHGTSSFPTQLRMRTTGLLSSEIV